MSKTLRNTSYRVILLLANVIVEADVPLPFVTALLQYIKEIDSNDTLYTFPSFSILNIVRLENLANRIHIEHQQVRPRA